MLSQTSAITGLNLKSIPERWGPSLVIVVGLAGVRDASTLTKLAGRPLVAIGGITLESAPGVISSGADSVAVISDLLTGDWRTRAALYLQALH